MKKVAVGTALTSNGHALRNSNRFILAFDEIKNLSSIVVGLPQFKTNKDCLAYRHLLLSASAKLKNADDQNAIVNGFIGPYKKMLDAFVVRIVESDLTWLQENVVKISKAGVAASIPLSEVYEWCMVNNEGALNDLECTLFLIFKHLQDPETPHGKALIEICKDFKVTEKEIQGAKAVQNIVRQVGQLNLGNQDGPPQTQDVMKMIQALVSGGGEDGGDMGAVARDMMSGKLTIPDLAKLVQESVQGGLQNEAPVASSEPSDANNVD